MGYSKSSKDTCFPWACALLEEEAHILQGVKAIAYWFKGIYSHRISKSDKSV